MLLLPARQDLADVGHGRGPSYENAQMPGYAWPSYAAYPNYAALTYPKQYSPTAWPYIGPFYPYPQVPLGWRKVTLEWDDGWWFLNFADDRRHCGHGHEADGPDHYLVETRSTGIDHVGVVVWMGGPGACHLRNLALFPPD